MYIFVLYKIMMHLQLMAPSIRWNMVLSQQLILLMEQGRADKSHIKCYQSFLSQKKTKTKVLFPPGRAVSPIPPIDKPVCTETHTWKYNHLNILIQNTANILNGADSCFLRIQNPSSTFTPVHKWHKLLINGIKNSYSVYIAAAMLVYVNNWSDF